MFPRKVLQGRGGHEALRQNLHSLQVLSPEATLRKAPPNASSDGGAGAVASPVRQQDVGEGPLDQLPQGPFQGTDLRGRAGHLDIVRPIVWRVG